MCVSICVTVCLFVCLCARSCEGAPKFIVCEELVRGQLVLGKDISGVISLAAVRIHALHTRSMLISDSHVFGVSCFRLSVRARVRVFVCVCT